MAESGGDGGPPVPAAASSGSPGGRLLRPLGPRASPYQRRLVDTARRAAACVPTNTSNIYLVSYVPGAGVPPPPSGKAVSWHLAELTTSMLTRPDNDVFFWRGRWREPFRPAIDRQLSVADLLCGSAPLLRAVPCGAGNIRVWNQNMVGEVRQLHDACTAGGVYGGVSKQCPYPVAVEVNMKSVNFNAADDGERELGKEELLNRLTQFNPDLSRLMSNGLQPLPDAIETVSYHLWPKAQVGALPSPAGNFQPLVNTVGVATRVITEDTLRGRSRSLLGQKGLFATQSFEAGVVIGQPGGQVCLANDDSLTESARGRYPCQYKMDVVKAGGQRVEVVLDPYQGYNEDDNPWNILLRRMNDPSMDLGGPNHMKYAFQQNCIIGTLRICGWPYPVIWAISKICIDDELTMCYGEGYRVTS